MTTTHVDLSGMTHQERRRIARLIHESNADWVVLVGSWARGTQTASTSDIDVLVGAPSPQRRPVQRRMHVFYLDDAQLRARVAAGDDVALWFLKFGVPLSGALRWRVLKQSLLEPRPQVDLEKKLDLARTQVRYAEDFLGMGDSEAAQDELHVGAEHLARALLIQAGLFPASRPEVPGQLRSIGHRRLAHLLDALREGAIDAPALGDAIRLSKDVARETSTTLYAERVRSDSDVVPTSEAAERRLKSGPPRHDEFSPRGLLEEADQPD